MSERLRILLVEDNPGDADLIVELLPEDSLGAFEIACAPRLAAALARVRTDRFDLVLLDLGLPDSAGLDTIRAMRQETGSTTPIVVLTGNNDEQMGLAAIQAGAQDYVVKGQTSGALLSRILRYALERHRDARRLRENEEQLSHQYAILRGIIESTDALIFSLDRAYRYTSFNHGHAAVMRALYGAEIQLGQSLLDSMTVATDRAAAQANLARALQGAQFTEESYSGDALLARRYFEISHSPITDATGQVVGVAVFSRDVSARRQAEEALRCAHDELELRVQERTAELQESESRYRTLVEEIPAATYIAALDDASSSLYNSPQIEQIIGFTAEEWTRDPELWLRQLHPDDRERVVAEVHHAHVTGAPFRCEYRLLARDGRVVWVEDQARVIYNPAGQPLYLQGVIFDFSERKRMEEALQQSEQNFKAIAENASDGILIAAGAGRHVYANQRAAEIMGYTVAELLETHLRDLAHPDEFGQLQARYTARLAGRMVPRQYETRIVRQDGQITPVELTANRTMWLGQPADLVVVRDITERKRLECELIAARDELELRVQERTAELLQSETMLRATLDAIPESAFLMQPDGVVLAANATVAQRLGVTVAQVIGASVYDLVAPEVAARRRHYVAQVLETGQPVRFEDQRSGQVIDNAIYPIFDAQGRVVQLSVLGLDITERRQAEAALHESERLLRETQALSKVGGWEYAVAEKQNTWTAEVYHIYGVGRDYDPNDIAQAISFYSEQDQQTIEQAFTQAVQSGVPYDLELQFNAADGRRKWVRTMGNPVFAAGKITTVVGNIIDITERKQAEAGLQASEENFRNLAENCTVHEHLEQFRPWRPGAIGHFPRIYGRWRQETRPRSVKMTHLTLC